MYDFFEQADRISKEVIGAAIEVHRLKGPGLLESIYEKCLCREFELRKIPFKNQLPIKIEYKGYIFEENLRVDFFVSDCLVIELKAAEQVSPVHKAQLLSYMKLLDAPLGLILNFHEQTLTNGISRVILPGANVS